MHPLRPSDGVCIFSAFIPQVTASFEHVGKQIAGLREILAFLVDWFNAIYHSGFLIWRSYVSVAGDAGIEPSFEAEYRQCWRLVAEKTGWDVN